MTKCDPIATNREEYTHCVIDHPFTPAELQRLAMFFTLCDDMPEATPSHFKTQHNAANIAFFTALFWRAVRRGWPPEGLVITRGENTTLRALATWVAATPNDEVTRPSGPFAVRSMHQAVERLYHAAFYAQPLVRRTDSEQEAYEAALTAEGGE